MIWRLAPGYGILSSRMHRILQTVADARMDLPAKDAVPFTQARAKLSELAGQVKAGAEKIITRNGESYVALIDAKRLDYYHRLERERIHLLSMEDAGRGRADIATGRAQHVEAAIDGPRKRRAAASRGPKKKRG